MTRPYTMSDKALEARRANAQQSTGPKTQAGKARSSRNAWRHGGYSAVHRAHFRNALGSLDPARLFGKPCVTTCPHHPDNPELASAPCSLVTDGLTRAGGSCLDRRVYVDAFASIIDAMQGGSIEGMEGLMASEMAAQLQVLHTVRESIAKDGVMITIPMIDDEGAVVLMPDGQVAPAKVILNPAIMASVKLLEQLGLNLPEAMASPRARERIREGDETQSAADRLLGTLLGQMGGADRLLGRGRVLEQEDEG